MYCVEQSDQYVSCRDVCEDFGLTCPGRCNRNYYGAFSNTPGCGVGGSKVNTDPCETPIDWDQRNSANHPLVGVDCCCDFVEG